jgi:8-oxo-dGTP pyrophosphatase MutT (NUDIX family)
MLITEQKLVVRSRGIIIHDEKLLTVKHAPNSAFYALPGGHIEHGEDPRECMARELEEELGIRGQVGRLLYVNTFMDSGIHSVEFFFEIINSAAYAGMERATGLLGKEIHEVRWIGPTENVRILPSKIDTDLRDATLLSDSVRFIKG